MAIVAYHAVASDGSLHGAVFETDTAERFKGSVVYGNSDVSKEDLYRTKAGGWIKNTVTLAPVNSDGGDLSKYIAISQSDAREWLKKNNHAEAVARLLP